MFSLHEAVVVARIFHEAGRHLLTLQNVVELVGLVGRHSQITVTNQENTRCLNVLNMADGRTLVD